MNEWEERIRNGIRLGEIYGGTRRWIEVDLDDLKAMLAELNELRCLLDKSTTVRQVRVNVSFKEDYLLILEYLSNDEAEDNLGDWSNWELAEYAIQATRLLQRMGFEEDDLWYEV